MFGGDALHPPTNGLLKTRLGSVVGVQTRGMTVWTKITPTQQDYMVALRMLTAVHVRGTAPGCGSWGSTRATFVGAQRIRKHRRHSGRRRSMSGGVPDRIVKHPPKGCGRIPYINDYGSLDLPLVVVLTVGTLWLSQFEK